jgi:transposase-like protein
MESVVAKNVKRYSMRFRQRVVERMQLEKNIVQLSRELGLDRSMMYIWKRKLEKRAYGNVRSGEVNLRDRQVKELKAKIAGLEGVIGRQALELDFFEGALRRIRETEPQNGAGGETASTPRSAVGANRKAD